jgi:hypothetical protein
MSGVYKVDLQLTSRTDQRLLDCMKVRYSHPGGFVGRNICHAVLHAGQYYGHIVGGSSTRFLPGRNAALGFNCLQGLNYGINNVFFHISPQRADADTDFGYPFRNFTQTVLACWRSVIQRAWVVKYGDDPVWLESLVELPRTGEVYRRDGWKMVGQTVGYTCKRVAGVGTDSWSGKRVWNTKREDLRPKLVFVYPLF